MVSIHNKSFEHLFCALFIKQYQLKTKPIENNLQPEELVHKLIETIPLLSPIQRYLLSSGERLHHHKIALILWYHVPNKFKDPEGYVHHLFLSLIKFVINAN